MTLRTRLSLIFRPVTTLRKIENSYQEPVAHLKHTIQLQRDTISGLAKLSTRVAKSCVALDAAVTTLSADRTGPVMFMNRAKAKVNKDWFKEPSNQAFVQPDITTYPAIEYSIGWYTRVHVDPKSELAAKQDVVHAALLLIAVKAANDLSPTIAKRIQEECSPSQS